jgi:hypothetical protein
MQLSKGASIEENKEKSRKTLRKFGELAVGEESDAGTREY